jgi:hypothetical protein
MEKKTADMCREFGLLFSAIQTISKNSTNVISVFERKGIENKAISKA